VSTGTPVVQRIREEYAGFARALGSRDAAAERRRAAIDALVASGLPSSRDENWRYANLRPLERQRFTPAVTTAPPAPGTLPGGFADFARYVFVDGVFAASASAALTGGGAALTLLTEDAADSSVAIADTGAGVADGSVATAAGSKPGNSSETARAQRLALLNDAFATGGVVIRVPAAASQPVRLELLFVASAEATAGASYPRVRLQLDPGARLTLIERHVSAATAVSFVASTVSAQLARGATLEHYRLQELNGRCVLFDTLSAQLAQEARYRLHGIASGAQSARSTMAVRLAGERAELTLAIAALGERAQVQDTFARVEHAAPRARTVQTFRGIAADRSRVAFNGKIVVARGAAGTDSQQSLRGLLAGPEAEIDVRPQLEIYTDDVRCSHGATAGKLDDNMLFYLLSRGLSPESAQRLLKWAFLEDVVAQIALPALRRQIEERLAAGLRDETFRELL
jgi:Fe-S cluster assembly protein SufD